MTDDPIAMQARHEAELDAANERIRQLEAIIQTLEAKNLELRRTVEELRASIHAKDLLLRTSVTGPVSGPTAMSRHDCRRELTNDDIRTSCTALDE